MISLNYRERATMQFVADGMSNGEIGKALFVAESTIKSRMKSIMQKLDANNRAHAVAISYRLGIIK